MTDDDLTEYDIKVLRVAAGEDVPGFSWGGATSVALEFLKGRGLVEGHYTITEAGRAFLAELEGG